MLEAEESASTDGYLMASRKPDPIVPHCGKVRS